MYRRRWFVALRAASIAFFIFYIAWNIAWILQGRLAPSLMIALTGLPAPTTGMTRGLLALAHGNWALSFFWNPFAVPLLLLFVFSLGWLGFQLVLRRRAVLPEWIFRSWLVLLAVAWVWKLSTSPAYW